MTELRVQGCIVFADGVPPLDRAAVHVYLEDTTYADASAVRLAEQSVPARPGDDGSIAFNLTVPQVDPLARLEVRVWIDVNGNGRIDSGDCVNMESFPVLTQGHPASVNVRVRRIR